MARNDSFPTMIWTWDADESGRGVMRPVRAYAGVAERIFTYGETYRLEPSEEYKNDPFRKAYFASLRDLWNNIPESYGNRWPSIDHWRYWLLCHTGWCTETNFALETEDDAKRLAKMLRNSFPFSVIELKQNSVRQLVPRSQARKAKLNKDGMTAEEFKQSAEAVLDMAADIVGISRADLRRRGNIA